MRLRARSFSSHPRSGGFTLIEVAIAIVIVAVGIIAVQSMVVASTRVTAFNDELQTAGMLSRAMQERCLNLDRDSLAALNGVKFSPPLDSQARVLSELTGYSQTVTVQAISPTNLSTGLSLSNDTGLLRITVNVGRHGRSIVASNRLLATTKQG